MDVSDQATRQEELMRELAIKRAANRVPVLPATGACHRCDALLPAGACFCDRRDCLQDWRREQDARRRGGLLA